MGLFDFIKGLRRNLNQFFADNIPENTTQNLKERVEIEFHNRNGNLTNIWIEPWCESINLVKSTEYKVISDDRFFRVEFDEDNQIIFYAQCSHDYFKIYKRKISNSINTENDWELVIDLFN